MPRKGRSKVRAEPTAGDVLTTALEAVKAVAVSNALPGGRGGDGEVQVFRIEDETGALLPATPEDAKRIAEIVAGAPRIPPPPPLPTQVLTDAEPEDFDLQASSPLPLEGSRAGGKTAAMKAAAALLTMPEFDAAAEAVARLDATVEKLGATTAALHERTELYRELYREADRRKILHLLDSDAELRDLVAKWFATNAALTRANGGEPPAAILPPLKLQEDRSPGQVIEDGDAAAYLRQMAETLDDSHSFAVGGIARNIDLDLTAIGLDQIWTGRLVKMASAAGTTPQKYLERLVRRAWVSLPSTMRVGS